MHQAPPPLNALRAFEAAARHLSLTKAALELNVTAGALSHQIRGLEEHLGRKLFERRVRAIALTAAGQQLYPGLMAAFAQINEAVSSLRRLDDSRVLVISTPPAFTAKWLAPRLYRFSLLHPDIDARVSSSINNANFTSDGVDVAIRNLPLDAPDDPALIVERLVEQYLVPVCSPRLIAARGPFTSAAMLSDVALIHDDTFSRRALVPSWADWFEAAGTPGVDVSRGLRFNSADHALDATVEGMGVLLAHDVLAHDDLRAGRLVIPFDLRLRSQRAYCLVYLKTRRDLRHVVAFREWIRQEIELMRKGG